MNISKCECGNGKSQYVTIFCRKCAKERNDKRIKENLEIWKTGKCPDCGEDLVRNNSLTGWIQCAQLGAEDFRKHKDLPSCSFQMFLV